MLRLATLKLTILAITFLFANIVIVKSQPTVDFTASVEYGCVPFEVSFTSNVEGCTGTVNYSWDFGYAGGSSSLANPTTLYNNSGTFTVTLNVSCAEGSGSHQMTIEAYEPPTAFFQNDYITGCVPLNINLTDNSTEGDAPISLRRWYWGDGTTAGTGINPTHTYNFTGIFDVLLEITDDNSCTSSFSIDDLVSVSDTPHIEFVGYPMSYCQPMTVSFQSMSQTQLNLDYEAYWNFGDGSPGATGHTTSHYYGDQGTYDVTLTVINDYGCTNDLTKENFITINQINPLYTVTEGDTVCINTPVHFYNLTSYNCTWDFGDGSDPVTQNSPTHFFNESGTYNVTFTVDPNGDCINDTVFEIYVEEVEANFSVSPTDLFSCDVPFIVNFTNESSDNATIFNYVFGDGHSSDEENPEHEYNNTGSFITSLSVTTANGCTDQFFGPTVNIVSPDASFETDTTEGCAPLPVVFNYIGTTPIGTITDWQWDFGDGNSSTDAETTTNTYQNPGDYTATLTVTDSDNCTGYYELEIYVGEVIPAEYAFEQWDEGANDWVELGPNDTLFCAQDTIRVHNLLWDNEDIDDIEWIIDSVPDNNGIEEYFEWTLDQDTGYISIFIVTNVNGCRDTVKLFDRFYISGPIIESIQKEFDCSNPFDYTFTVDITDGDRWDWSFDDGSPDILNSTETSINHSFPGTGEYWLTVIAYNDDSGCEYIDSIRIEIQQPEAIFYPNNNNVCINDPVIFSGDNSIDAVLYHWDFGDGEVLDWSENAFPQHSYSSTGDFEVTLTVEDANGCQSSSSLNIHVVGPQIEIFANPGTHGCNELEVDFSCNVTHDPDYNIIYRLWSFSNGYTNTQEAFTYTFTPGNYDVALTISISNGVSTCHNTLSLDDYITVTNLQTDVQTFQGITTGCAGDEMQFFSGLSDTNLNYNWDFDDGQTSNEINPTHVFNSGGSFNVTLEVDDGLGCNAQGNIEVEIQEVDANFTIETTHFNCYPAFLNITNNADPDAYNPSFEWIMRNLETGSTDTLPLFEPEDYYFNTPGTYEITLNVGTPFGCTWTNSQIVTVDGPRIEWEIEPDTICAGESVNFTVFNMENVDSYTWYVQGEPIINLPDFDHTFTNSPPGGFHEIQLSVEGGGCNPIFELRVYVQEVIADFEILDTSFNASSGGCSPFVAHLIDGSIDADSLYWYIEEQIYQNLDSVMHTFNNISENDSSYIITLIASNELGCKDTVSKEITAYASPQIQITPDTIICLGDTFTLVAIGGDDYTWSPQYNITGFDTNTPSISPEENTVYTVHVTNTNNCESYDSVYVMVQQIPDISVYPDSISIVIGDSVYVEVLSDQENITYMWIPQDEISCFDCPTPVMSPKEDTRYTVMTVDSLGCFEHNYNVDIYVIVEYTLDVPSAFTPLGHEENRIVKVKGFGIKNLLEFRIYNRWGEEVFYTDDIEQGWDGYVNGKLQNIDTYVYYVKAEMWDGTVKTIKGDLLLLR
jgi:gliding motility-associated-like protein